MRPLRATARSLTAAAAISVLALLGPALGARPALAKTSRTRRPTKGTIVHVVLTTATLNRALSEMPSLTMTPNGWVGARTLEVEDNVRYQRMLGFGGGMTDSSAWLLYDELPAPTRQTVMRELFSASGINLNFIRVPMGASDFTATGVPYTYDDLAPGLTDPLLLRFSVAHDDAYIVPALKRMLAINPSVDVLSTEWSPPAWMKANDSLGNVGGHGTLLPSYYGTLATYFEKFIAAYAARGIHIWGITPQNEPDAQTPYPGMELPAASEAQFIIQNLAPTLRSAGLHPRIYGLDEGSALAYAQALEQDGSGGDLAGMAWHCYGGQQVVSTFRALHPALSEITSECSPGIVPYAPAEETISGLRNWTSAMDLWNLALDPAGGPVQPPNSGCKGCTGLVTVSESSHSAQLGLNYYQLGQFSKYVQRGATRVYTPRWVSEFRNDTTGAYGVSPGLDNVAFVNPDGSHVLIAYDNSLVPVTFGLRYHNQGLKFTLAANATVTFTWK